MKKWVCTVCGYVHEGEEPPQECPLCGVGPDQFEEIDEYSYQWGMSDDERTLAQYLGLNAEEEDAWVSISEDALRELLDKQRRK